MYVILGLQGNAGDCEFWHWLTTKKILRYIRFKRFQKGLVQGFIPSDKGCKDFKVADLGCRDVRFRNEGLGHSGLGYSEVRRA